MPHSEAPSPNAAAQSQRLEEVSQNQHASPSSYLGLRKALSPSINTRAVTIAQHHDIVSPLMLEDRKSIDDLRFEACRLSPRKLPTRGPKSRHFGTKPSCTSSPAPRPPTPAVDSAASSVACEEQDEHAEPLDEGRHLDLLIDQVSSWIKEERAKRSRRKTQSARSENQAEHGTPQSFTAVELVSVKHRCGSDVSDESFDLDKLDRIVKQNLTLRRPLVRRASVSSKHRPSIRRLLKKQHSGTSHEVGNVNEIQVPTCDAVLDNSKTLAYTGGASDLSDDSGAEDLQRVRSYRDVDAWAKFKFEIVRITHTLRLKGWRKVPLEMSSAIHVQRLSGALTNAVYVVAPPDNLPPQKEDESGNAAYSKPPLKLLLRIYGPQVDHLIDREAELAILRRLAKKRIGPSLLGTFVNGRFEEYLHAKPLTPDDLRDPSTSQQIAKRMRELHAGVDLLDDERRSGAFVWLNWDKWLHRVEQIVTWMDQQILALEPGVKPTGSQAWMRRGHICGVPWKTFKDVVTRYRAWLDSQYGGPEKLREHLVFSHNDTQYGNILRVVPTGDSPLLLPANTHKQLVVIDFEYSSANTRGLEFANHFTEWCYNYHDARKPHACNVNRYPTKQEQDRFIRAYVRHRPEFDVIPPKMSPMTTTMNPKTTAAMNPPDSLKRSASSISEFMLDARKTPVSPSPASSLQEGLSFKAVEDAEVAGLMNEARMWRLANTAQWIAWGVIQAKVPGMPLFDFSPPASDTTKDTNPEELLGERAEEYRALAQTHDQVGKDTEQEEEFDYLGYAQHRALFFWGDAVQMGFIQADELPEQTRAKLKTPSY